jgi:hypothetical protein
VCGGKDAISFFAVARWPGGHSYLSSRKIYELCSIKGQRMGEVEALRVRRQRLDQLRIPLRYLVATAATLATGSFLAP